MKRILIAEDDKFLANAYRVKLGGLGFDIKIVFDGDETIKQIKEFRPDLILLDLVMPKMDGFAVLEEMKKNPDLKMVPVIVASNLGQEEDIQRARKLGASDYIIKADSTLSQLAEKIKTALK